MLTITTIMEVLVIWFSLALFFCLALLYSASRPPPSASRPKLPTTGTLNKKNRAAVEGIRFEPDSPFDTVRLPPIKNVS